ncbi:LLM class flavin-dependent oxidoreductase [Actinocatenispora rupis]|nr:LLM class flavin-dependent oxidoreductase [Actinocatenispora rupis]
MRVSTVILPIYRWAVAADVWRRAEELGCHAAYTYDHLSWREPFRDGTWFGAVPTLTAAATVTSRLRLGTMVTSPNFRHPVPLAKDLMSVDDVSGGRLTVGVGSGGTGFDARVLGAEPWSPRERADRFAEFVPLLDRLLREPTTTDTGRYYSAHEARMVPGCVQRPRVPLYVAATGPRGLALATRYGDGWVTTADDPADEIARLAAACADAGRDPAGLDRVVLTGFGPLPDSPAGFVDLAGRYAELGVTELVVHWPVPDTQFAMDQGLFERVVTALT